MSAIFQEVENLAIKAEKTGQFKLASTLYGITALLLNGSQDELNSIICQMTKKIQQPIIIQ